MAAEFDGLAIGRHRIAEEARERTGKLDLRGLGPDSVGESLPLLVAAAIADVKEMDLGVREPVEKPVWTLDERVKSRRIAVMSRARHRGVSQDLSRRSDPGFELIGRASAESLFYRNRYLEEFGVERRGEDDPPHASARSA
jgi:hypothetical protein